MARRAAALGIETVGVDPTHNQIAVPGNVAVVRATARRAPSGSCPSCDEAFDAVLMCLVIEHIDPMEPADRGNGPSARAGRTLPAAHEPPAPANHGGSGWIDDHILEEQYWRVGPYLRDDSTIEEVAPGVNLPFMHRPLSRYIHVMGQVGLLLEDMDEPAPPPGFLDEAWEYGDASTIPRLMLLRARRVQ